MGWDCLFFGNKSKSSEDVVLVGVLYPGFHDKSLEEFGCLPDRRDSAVTTAAGTPG
jgi:hypothetical protein